jgi:SAM-dependent methyltransferase
MNFSNEWENLFSDPRSNQISRWPWSDLVTYVMRYARPTGPGFRVLELGCGSGANVPFFKFMGVDYSAIEGSESAVAMLKKAYPDWADRFAVTDFTQNLYFDGPFDLIVDRGSVCHNSTDAIQKTVALAHENLKIGGKYIAIDWFSTELGDYTRGEQAEDRYTRKNITEGDLAGVGRVHFSDREHIEDIFRDFKITRMVHKILTHEVPSDHITEAYWNYVAEKK